MKIVAVWTVVVPLVIVSTAYAGTPSPTFDDVVYAFVPRDDGGIMALRMDVYLPAGSGPFPCVVWIHGGAWLAGTYQIPPAATGDLLERGIALASVQYRLSQQAIFPAQIHDVKGAIRFLRAHAEAYSLDPSRMATWGESAGGHLAALAATSGDVGVLEGETGGNLEWSSRVSAAVDHFGPTDILNMNLDVTTPPGSIIDHDAPDSPESHLVGWDGPGQGIGDIRDNMDNPNPPYPALVELCFQVNPVTWATYDDPPMFIAHGTLDTLVPIFQSTRLSRALSGAGVGHDYRQVAGAGHGYLGAPTISASVAFVQNRLVDAVPVPGDGNGDGDVDLFDFAGFSSCASGPDVTDLPPLCQPFDLDHDLDVDLRDISLFQLAFTGAH